MVADIIDPHAEAIGMDAMSTRSVWISCQVPNNAVVGTYSGVLSIKTGKRTIAKLPLYIKVIDRILPEPKDWKFHLDLWQNPFAEARYIDHIRLFPRHVHGAEGYNAARSDFENAMAEQYVRAYGLIPFAGSDNHIAQDMRKLGGMQTDTEIRDEKDFIARVKSGEITPFRKNLDDPTKNA